MAITYANLDELHSISKEIVQLANDFDYEINGLFKRISQMPTVTREWVGPTANMYVSKALKDKVQYNTFASDLKNLGFEIESNAYNIQECIITNSRNE
jgi:hypothetical protein